MEPILTHATLALLALIATTLAWRQTADRDYLWMATLAGLSFLFNALRYGASGLNSISPEAERILLNISTAFSILIIAAIVLILLRGRRER